MSKKPTTSSEPLVSKIDKDINMLTPESSPGTSPQKRSSLAEAVDEKMKMKMKTMENESFKESMKMNIDAENANSADKEEKMKMKMKMKIDQEKRVVPGSEAELEKMKMKMKIDHNKGVAFGSEAELEKMKMKMKIEQEKGVASSSINIPTATGTPSTEEQEKMKMKMRQKDATPGTSPDQISEDMKMKMNMKMKTGSTEMDVTPVTADAEEEKMKMKLKMKMKMNVTANPSDSQDQNLTQTTTTSPCLFKSAKPPNVLVYSEVTEIRDGVIQSLKHVLGKDIYTIYPLTQEIAKSNIWIENATLLIVCGNVADDISQLLLEFLLSGGKLLSLCSNLLHTVFPSFKNSQVLEQEIVQISYGLWQNVTVLHQVFAGLPSPIKNQFSIVQEEEIQRRNTVELTDIQGTTHELQYQVLGAKDTSNTPSLILVKDSASNGVAVFSQIHLVTSPSQLMNDVKKFQILKDTQQLRLDILSNLLSLHLGVGVAQVGAQIPVNRYSSAYFLGSDELKQQALVTLRERMTTPNVVKTPKYFLHFCVKEDPVPTASDSLLPIEMDSLPDNFSTAAYFDSLKTEGIGRLVIYASVLTSSTHVIAHLKLPHGTCVIPRTQTNGIGRSNNQWLSPEGCAMFSMQLHVALESPLGQRITLAQHLIAVAVIHGITSLPGYENLNIRLKWPNDIYANGHTKIGGLLINTTIEASKAILNVGCGTNLSNSHPTLCINDLIRQHNASSNNQNLSLLTHERFFAVVFNEIEVLFNRVQMGDFNYLYSLYYKYWLHSNAEVKIVEQTRIEKTAKVLGIDKLGYLLVKTSYGRIESVHPDGNSFDMLRGLIVPKTHRL